jgi:predicted phage terminase large subunit-like protein
MLSENEIDELERLLHAKNVDKAKSDLLQFTKMTMPSFTPKQFHVNYYKILDFFVHGLIKRLMITVPPQHGKSEGSTRRLPAQLLGINPDCKIAIGSYSTTFARKFNRDVQRIIDTPEYHEIFPNTTLNQSNVVTITDQSLRNSEEFEIVGYRGSLKAVGRGGPLTGNPVDVMIMDDLYKDAMEGNSPIIRQGVWDWYSSVVTKRLHNDSQQLIVFTRWHQEDLIGMLEKKDTVITINSFADVLKLPKDFDGWLKINFEAIKESDTTELDPRAYGEALWPDKHSLKKLQKEREQDKETFNCMNQGNPISQEGLLYRKFSTYTHIPTLKQRMAYVDTADKGNDYLCAVAYGVPLDSDDDCFYVLDVVYTKESMEITEPIVARMFDNNGITDPVVESNNGGRGFARAVQKLVRPNCTIETYTQTKNKEARIISNSSAVNKRIVFPEGWQKRWPEFYNDLSGFKKLFNANAQDGAPDVLTAIVELDEASSGVQIIW